MGAVRRGILNAFRNNLRTVSIVFILAISISMAMVMLISLKTVQQKITDVKGSIGNYITVSPAGIRGFEGGGELLTADDVASVESIDGVTKVVSTVSDRLNTDSDTNLQSATEAGSFGGRQRQFEESSSSSFSSSNRPTMPTNFSMPITAMGSSDLTSLASLNTSQFTITSGEKFDEGSSEKVALVGKGLAEKNSLSVGSTFIAHDATIKVAGIFDAGNDFVNAMLVMPVNTIQEISAQSGEINSIIAEASSIDQVESVKSAIEKNLGDKVDVTTSQDSSQSAIAPLENIKSISLYSLIGSLAAGAIIIFLTMVMIVRERRREIGVLKAIGASNLIISSQFMIESMFLTIMGSIIGIIAGTLLSNPILKVLVQNSESSTTSSSPGQGVEGFGRAAMRLQAGIGGARDTLTNLHATVGWEIILYGLFVAVVIAIIGSAIPSYLIAKVRPAEILRSE
jgi:putative ABC transport system permease protein